MSNELKKPTIWKRASAFLFDAILLVTLTMGIAFIISAITGYDRYATELDELYTKYEEQYGVSFDITEDEYTAMSAEEREIFDSASRALQTDSESGRLYGMVLNLTVMTISLSFLFAYMGLEFVVPLLFGNGQTLGKKAFGIALVRIDGVKLTPVMLFVRTLLGKYTLETMVPVFIVIMILFRMLGITGTAVLGLYLVFQIILFFATKERRLVHDIISGTAAVDMSTQRIFESVDELTAYKARLARERMSREE